MEKLARLCKPGFPAGEKNAPVREPEKNSGLGRCISLVKDDLSIGRIAAGISPAGTNFSVPACMLYLT
ncbi:hypothetical protein [Salmonella enterica]|uniref:hypothetical protein n=1 Tax=Salmonella enterica TaxID=28901 RepID=UPI0009AED6F0|nr:hypothetical protein [Salmonella enterica]